MAVVIKTTNISKNRQVGQGPDPVPQPVALSQLERLVVQSTCRKAKLALEHNRAKRCQDLARRIKVTSNTNKKETTRTSTTKNPVANRTKRAEEVAAATRTQTGRAHQARAKQISSNNSSLINKTYNKWSRLKFRIYYLQHSHSMPTILPTCNTNQVAKRISRVYSTLLRTRRLVQLVHPLALVEVKVVVADTEAVEWAAVAEEATR